MSKNIIISRSEAKSIIEKAFVNKSDGLLWHLNDKIYRLPTVQQITETLNNFITKPYIVEIADCDNRAFLLAAKFVEQSLSVGVIDVEQLCFGPNDPHYRHQLCMTITSDTKTLVVLEPETHLFFQPNELLRLMFVDFRT